MTTTCSGGLVQLCKSTSGKLYLLVFSLPAVRLLFLHIAIYLLAVGL